METQRNTGYGSESVSPICNEGVLLVMIQCIARSMIDALMVGCMFVKTPGPEKRVETPLFSFSLMFSFEDLRKSHMVDAKMHAKFIPLPNSQGGVPAS